MMIKYPTKKSTYQRQKTSVKNRGMNFEALIDETNTFYRLQKRAVIYKKPIPIQIVKVDYPDRQHAKIKEAYYKTPSTTDYNGIYKGYYIDFDVKETKNKTSFPLKNIHAHQIDHLRAIDDAGGIAFLLIRFVVHNTVHLLPIDALNHFLERAKTGRQSFTYQELVSAGLEVNEGYRPTFDYLSAVDTMIKTIENQ
jgi:recombination protein U